MAEITATLVKELRDRTGAGMMECKKALVEAKGDLGEAEVVLRKRGIAAASKKSSRATRQGLISAYLAPDARSGVLVEVNCESDFVARTEEFQSLVTDLGQHIAELNPKAVRNEDGAAVQQEVGHTLYGQPFFKDQTVTVEQLIATKIAKIGENIGVSRFTRFHLGEQGDAKNGRISAYIHPGAQLGVMVELQTAGPAVEGLQTLVHDIAMQIAASDPEFISREDVTQAALDRERDIQRGRALNEGKPEKMVEKIVEGRMNKFYEEVCLLEQPFVKENSITVQQLLAKAGDGLKVARFVRFKVGDTQPVTTASE